MQQQEVEGFKKKRQQFTKNIRKNNRQEMFMKRRNMDNSQNGNQAPTQKIQKQIIVDESMRTFIIQFCNHQYELSQLTNLIQLAKSQNIIEKHRAIIGIRKLSLAPSQYLAQTIIQKKLIKNLVQWCAQNEYPQLKYQIIWIFTNLTQFDEKISQQLVKEGYIPILCQILTHENQHIVFQSIWNVANLAADSTKFRDELNQRGAVMKILHFLSKQRKNSEICTSVWALTNLARNNPPPKYELVKFVVPTVAQALKSGIIKNEQIISDCLWTLAILSEGSKIRLQRVVETNVTAKVVSYLNHNNWAISVPAIRLVGNFTSGPKQITDQVINSGFFDIAIGLLDRSKWVFVKQVCWALSNIAAGTDQQIVKLLQRQDLIVKILQVYNKYGPQVKIQIIFLFTNLQRSDIPKVILQLFKAIGLIQMIGELLKQDHQKILKELLSCLYKVLSFGRKCLNDRQQNQLLVMFVDKGYAPYLQKLQKHQNPRIHSQCVKIMEEFFDIEQSKMIDI